MNIVTIEEQTFKQVCGRFSGFVSQVERICKENTHQPEKWLSGREVCALLDVRENKGSEFLSGNSSGAQSV